MICSSTISKPRLILSETSIWCKGNSCKLGRRMLSLISIIYPMVIIKGWMTNLSTDLIDWSFWPNSIRIRLNLLKLIEVTELRGLSMWSSTTSATSISIVISTSSSIGSLIKVIVVRLWISCCCHSKDSVFYLKSFILRLFFYIKHGGEFIKTQVSTLGPYSWSECIELLGESLESNVEQFFIIHNNSNT